MKIDNYYSSQGNYLQEHSSYFTRQRLRKEVLFLIDVMKLKKSDTILDLACGQGRHTIELKKRGFKIEGIDFSRHLLSIAKAQAVKEDLNIVFHRKNINSFILPQSFDKIFLFFSEFGLFDARKVLNNIYNALKNNGLFLLDCDSIFRLIRYLQTHPKSPFSFDCERMQLQEKNNARSDIISRYYAFSEITPLFKEIGFRILAVFGGYRKEPFTLTSQRMIIVAKKSKNQMFRK